MDKKIVAYVKTGCPWCEGVKDYFKETDREAVDAYLKKAAQ